MMFIEEASEITEEQFSKLVPQTLTRGVFAMTTERCKHCGRALHQKQGSVWDELHKQFNSLKCIRCDDGAKDYHNGKRHGNIEIAHANAVRMAWYWRAKARRRAFLWGLFWKRLREMTVIAWKYRNELRDFQKKMEQDK